MQIRPATNRFLGIVKKRSRPPAVDLALTIDVSDSESTQRTAYHLVQQLQPLFAHLKRPGALFVEVVTVGAELAKHLEADGEPPLHKGDVVAVQSFAGEIVHSEDGEEYLLLSQHDIAGRLTLEEAPVIQ